MLRIRLSRTGAKKKPSYRVVVIEKERARDGKPVEVVGYYNPLTNPATIRLNRERIQHWMDRGALPSDTVRELLNAPSQAA